MSQKRQDDVFDRVVGGNSQIATLTRDYPAGHVIPSHFHNRGQLVYAARGVMTIAARAATWVVPTYRAVWIPPATVHSITMSGKVAMRTLYFAGSICETLPPVCQVVNVSPLLKELILYACQFSRLTRTVAVQRHIIEAIVDQLQIVEVVPLHLPNPSDPRALRVVERLQSDPGSTRSLARLCERVGASKRTIERLFQDEVGMSLGKWRQQLRLIHAMRHLAGGANVIHASLEAGYRTPSAFIVMFRKVLGTTPRSYFGHTR